jgi:hypothetical protein
MLGLECGVEVRLFEVVKRLDLPTCQVVFFLPVFVTRLSDEYIDTIIIDTLRVIHRRRELGIRVDDNFDLPLKLWAEVSVVF